MPDSLHFQLYSEIFAISFIIGKKNKGLSTFGNGNCSKFKQVKMNSWFIAYTVAKERNPALQEFQGALCHLGIWLDIEIGFQIK